VPGELPTECDGIDAALAIFCGSTPAAFQFARCCGRRHLGGLQPGCCQGRLACSSINSALAV
jgi:hypothetical protein